MTSLIGHVRALARHPWFVYAARFFNRFREGGTHEGYLTADELRLLSEWLDIGAQYYNDPFRPTPQN